MKFRSLAVASHAVSPTMVVAFSVPQQHGYQMNGLGSSSPVSTSASRRDVFETIAATTTASLGGFLPGLLQHPENAVADVDFSAIQDLLGPTNQEPQEYKPGGKRPTYLTEPTEEFKVNEQKAMEFKRKNLQIKKQFADALDKIGTDPNDANTLATDLDVVRRLVKSNGGLPEGITKDEVVKICRRRKSKKFWPTDVEIAYQDLLAEISYQQSPNTGRDTSFL